MKRSRFTEEQVIAILCEHKAGHKTADRCRRHGISSATFYAWKAKFGGLDVSQARKLRVLEDVNAKLRSCWPRRRSRQHACDPKGGVIPERWPQSLWLCFSRRMSDIALNTASL